MRTILAMAFVAALAACGPGDTRKVDPAAAAAPKPSETMAQTFSGCTWEEVKGATASIWSFACGPEHGNIRLVADDALPGFVIRSGDPAAPGQSTAIRFFSKPADAPLDAILPAVRAASPGAASATCAFEPAPGADHEGKPRFVFGPTGAAKAAYDLANQGPDVPEPPCGAMGPAPAGDRTFEVLAPDTVAFIEWGSEIQIFDASTLKLHTAHEEKAAH